MVFKRMGLGWILVSAALLQSASAFAMRAGEFDVADPGDAPTRPTRTTVYEPLPTQTAPAPTTTTQTTTTVQPPATTVSTTTTSSTTTVSVPQTNTRLPGSRLFLRGKSGI